MAALLPVGPRPADITGRLRVLKGQLMLQLQAVRRVMRSSELGFLSPLAFTHPVHEAFFSLLFPVLLGVRVLIIPWLLASFLSLISAFVTDVKAVLALCTRSHLPPTRGQSPKKEMRRLHVLKSPRLPKVSGADPAPTHFTEKGQGSQALALGHPASIEIK